MLTIESADLAVLELTLVLLIRGLSGRGQGSKGVVLGKGVPSPRGTAVSHAGLGKLPGPALRSQRALLT